MNTTKIEWCDSTWNPVTGCKHGCEYCYARRIARRFGGASETHNNEMCHECQWITEADGGEHELNSPIFDYDRGHKAPFPFEFDPTFHGYRLDEPAQHEKPQNIFVCSMADLFGEWVPEEWIKAVFAACERAPQHTYLFLTKNPSRYLTLAKAGKLPKGENYWYGSTITGPEAPFFFHASVKTFVSIEPLLGPFIQEEYDDGFQQIDWIILGAMTGPGSRKRQPKREWVEAILAVARKESIPVFMKDSMRGVWPELVREYPAGMRIPNGTSR